jgi:hypothetical protein
LEQGRHRPAKPDVEEIASRHVEVGFFLLVDDLFERAASLTAELLGPCDPGISGLGLDALPFSRTFQRGRVVVPVPVAARGIRGLQLGALLKNARAALRYAASSGVSLKSITVP